MKKAMYRVVKRAQTEQPDPPPSTVDASRKLREGASKSLSKPSPPRPARTRRVRRFESAPPVPPMGDKLRELRGAR
jgi:hypothetical protein